MFEENGPLAGHSEMKNAFCAKGKVRLLQVTVVKRFILVPKFVFGK